MLVKLDHFPRYRGEHSKIFELPPPKNSCRNDASEPKKNKALLPERVTCANGASYLSHDFVGRGMGSVVC